MSLKLIPIAGWSVDLVWRAEGDCRDQLGSFRANLGDGDGGWLLWGWWEFFRLRVYWNVKPVMSLDG